MLQLKEREYAKGLISSGAIARHLITFNSAISNLASLHKVVIIKLIDI